MIRLPKAEQGADALMVPSPTRNGKRTYLLLVYLDYPPVYYAAFAWLATVIANRRTYGCSGVDILQHKKAVNPSTMNLAARTAYSSAAADFCTFRPARRGVNGLNAGPNVGLFVFDWEVLKLKKKMMKKHAYQCRRSKILMLVLVPVVVQCDRCGCRLRPRALEDWRWLMLPAADWHTGN